MYRITDECIACTLCEPECPVGAIGESSPIAFAIDTRCDGCKDEPSPFCVEVCPVACIVLDLTEQERVAGLTDPDPSVRLKHAQISGSRKLPPSMIQYGLADPVDEVRAEFSARTDFTPDETQIECGLTDPFPRVRAAFAARRDFTPSEAQVERGLIDSSVIVRRAFAVRSDITLSGAQIERGLADDSAAVRAWMARRTEFCPSPEQLERGLCDADVSVRSTFISRGDCTLSLAQIERASKESAAAIWNPLLVRYGRLNAGAVPGTSIDPAEQKRAVPERSDGDSILKECSTRLSAEVKDANGRLRQYVTPRSIVAAIRRAAETQSCILLQPGHSGYAWSNRKIPVVLVVGFPEFVRVRVARSRSYQNNGVTPAVWPELRGFPRGDVAKKLRAWCEAGDGDSISTDIALALPIGDPDCRVAAWRMDHA